jgi:hypothetical protein
MANILEQANKIVNERSEEKERQYGPFQASMERAAALYNLMSPKDQQITTAGMYRAMIALKLSREAYAHKEDNLLDAVAYMGSMNDYLEEHKSLKPEPTIWECIEKHPDSCKGCEYFDEANSKCKLNKR